MIESYFRESDIPSAATSHIEDTTNAPLNLSKMQQKYVWWTQNFVYYLPELTPVTLWARCVNFYTLNTFRCWHLSAKVTWRSYISGYMQTLDYKGMLQHLVVVTWTVLSPRILKRFCIHTILCRPTLRVWCVHVCARVCACCSSAVFIQGQQQLREPPQPWLISWICWVNCKCNVPV